jgi:Concanavalin A-like lectin/glucanases superfamily
MENQFGNVANRFGNAANQMGANVNRFGANINQAVGDVNANVQTGLDKFGDPQEVATKSTEFLQSNTLAAKIAFTILVLIIFAFLIALGVNLIAYFTQTASNPYIVQGLMDGTNSIMIPGSSVNRSNNQTRGIEFTWSVWLQVNDLGNASRAYQHVFNKGNGDYDISPNTVNGTTYAMGSGLATVNNAPGLYLANKDAQVGLHVVMDTVDSEVGSVTIDVTGIPLNKKWIHVAIRLENTMLDVYVNGTISGRQVTTSVPKQNYGDVYACQNGGYSGKMSDLRYFQHALSAFEINQIVTKGPSTTASKLASASSKGSPYYLSNNWYFSKL